MILNEIKLANDGSSIVPDGIPTILIKKCQDSFAPLLTLVIIFNTCIHLGFYPKLWKESYITPIALMFPIIVLSLSCRPFQNYWMPFWQLN